VVFGAFTSMYTSIMIFLIFLIPLGVLKKANSFVFVREDRKAKLLIRELNNELSFVE